LYEIYPQIRDKLSIFLNLHRILRRKDLTASNVEWFANAIKTGAIKLSELQGQYKNLQNEIQDMQYQKQELERELQVIDSQIIQLADVENMHQQNFDTLGDKICDLQDQKHRLEQFAYRFKNSNKKYLKVKSIAEEVVNRLFTEQESLLDLALKAVIEALRMNPDRYAVIYNSRYDNNYNDNIFESNASTIADISSPSTKNHQNYYYNEYHEGILEIANSFLKILTNQIVDRQLYHVC
jgi:chromosome segregation ATPase